YDLENRMTSATMSGTQTTYTYDGDGDRLSAITGASSTKYVWDINELLPLLALERDSSGLTLRDYSYAAGLNSMTASGSSYFYLLDAYSNAVNLTSSSGATEWTYGYDPFGGDSGTTKNDSNAPTNVVRFNSEL